MWTEGEVRREFEKKGKESLVKGKNTSLYIYRDRVSMEMKDWLSWLSKDNKWKMEKHENACTLKCFLWKDRAKES